MRIPIYPILLTLLFFPVESSATSASNLNPVQDWQDVAPAKVMIGRGGDVRGSAPDVFNNDHRRAEAFESAVRTLLERQLAAAGLKTNPASKHLVGIDIWGRPEQRGDCRRTIYILRVWFGDNNTDPEAQVWSSDLVGSAADSELEADLLSTVTELLDYEFGAPKPSQP
ncbi:MAG TPA: hypothetical protein VGX68_19365 [Thermoanaerobaculia bacterium]|nr:hypothetical protein [Thermoanaerobaculia bacterium]